MDNDRHRSTEIPVDITVESDIEPVVFCAGKYIVEPNGFSLRFSFGDGEYIFTRKNGVSVFSSFGILNYTVDLSKSGDIEVNSIYGKMTFFAEPKTDEVTENDGGVKVNLEYFLTGGGQTQRRQLKIEARFIKE